MCKKKECVSLIKEREWKDAKHREINRNGKRKVRRKM